MSKPHGYKVHEIEVPLAAALTAAREALARYRREVYRELDPAKRKAAQLEVSLRLDVAGKLLCQVGRKIFLFDCPRHWSPTLQKWVPTTRADVAKWERLADMKREQLSGYYEQRLFRDGRKVAVTSKKSPRLKTKGL